MTSHNRSASRSDSEPPDDNSVSSDGRSFLFHDSDGSELRLLAHTLGNNHPDATSHRPADKSSPILQAEPPEIVEFQGSMHINDPAINTSTSENKPVRTMMMATPDPTHETNSLHTGHSWRTMLYLSH